MVQEIGYGRGGGAPRFKGKEKKASVEHTKKQQ